MSTEVPKICCCCFWSIFKREWPGSDWGGIRSWLWLKCLFHFRRLLSCEPHITSIKTLKGVICHTVATLFNRFDLRPNYGHLGYLFTLVPKSLSEEFSWRKKRKTILKRPLLSNHLCSWVVSRSNPRKRARKSLAKRFVRTVSG